jgi:hypothetical protein
MVRSDRRAGQGRVEKVNSDSSLGWSHSEVVYDINDIGKEGRENGRKKCRRSAATSATAVLNGWESHGWNA